MIDYVNFSVITAHFRSAKLHVSVLVSVSSEAQYAAESDVSPTADCESVRPSVKHSSAGRQESRGLLWFAVGG